MWESVNIPYGINASLDDIFGAILIAGIDRNNPENFELYERKQKIAKICLSRFEGNFLMNVFNNSYAIFYEIIMTLRVKEFTAEQMFTLVDNNRDLIVDSPYISRSRYKETQSGNVITDDDFIQIVKINLGDKLVELSRREVSEEQFSSACITYIEWYRNALGEYTALSMAAIMSMGFEHKKAGKRRVTYRGLEDMKKFYNENMGIIESLKQENRIQHTALDDKWFEDEIREEGKKDDNALFKTGIKELDDIYGELRRGHVIGILGPPKGGKTRFTNFLVQTALQSGYNVCVWSLEGSRQEWEAMQVASLIAYDSYHSAKSNKEDEMIRISDDAILKKKYAKSPELRKQVIAAKKVLSSGTKLGRLSFIESPAFVETMFDEMEYHYNNVNPFDVIVVDQLIDVMSKNRRSKTETISEAYQGMKNFVERRLPKKVLGLMPSQLKQVVIDELRRNSDSSIDVTAGGESAETIRTPDEVWGLFSNKEERANNMIKMYSVASRHSAEFRDFQLKAFLGCCFFCSQDD